MNARTAIPRGVVVVALTAATACHPAPLPDHRASDLAALVDAERAFARMAMAQGQRDAWLAWFAPDGLMLRPGGLVNAQAFMRQDDAVARAAPPGAFDWRPVYGDVARSGDLGYSTGPVRIIALGRSDRYYFSVWRKQPDGGWRVVLDLGTQVAIEGRDPFDDPYVPADPVAPARGGGTIEALVALDRDSLISSAGFEPFLDPAVRGLRWREPPLVGRPMFRRIVAGGPGPLRHQPAGGALSASGDLGYTFGRYSLGAASGSEQQGTYARVWRRDATGAWRIVFDVARPDGPQGG